MTNIKPLTTQYDNANALNAAIEGYKDIGYTDEWFLIDRETNQLTVLTKPVKKKGEKRERNTDDY